MVLGKRMNELKLWASQELEVTASQKNRFLAGGSESSLGKLVPILLVTILGLIGHFFSGKQHTW